jgi:hypothetical protein
VTSGPLKDLVEVSEEMSTKGRVKILLSLIEDVPVRLEMANQESSLMKLLEV